MSVGQRLVLSLTDLLMLKFRALLFYMHIVEVEISLRVLVIRFLVEELVYMITGVFVSKLLPTYGAPSEVDQHVHSWLRTCQKCLSKYERK